MLLVNDPLLDRALVAINGKLPYKFSIYPYLILFPGSIASFVTNLVDIISHSTLPATTTIAGIAL